VEKASWRMCAIVGKWEGVVMSSRCSGMFVGREILCRLNNEKPALEKLK